MIITHAGKFGDFIPTLTISNYYWKNHKEKTKFVLSKWFEKICGLKEFLLIQDFVEDVIFDPHVAESFNMGAQPYKFKPECIKDDEKYYNIGFWHPANQWYLADLYCREHDLKYDTDIKINFVDKNFPEELKNKKIYTAFFEDRWDKDRYEVRFTPNETTHSLSNNGYEVIDDKKPILHNLNLAYYSGHSDNVVCYPSGFSVLLDICNIDFHLINGSVNPCTYYLNHR
jgi:hypothetical protein